jgi:hypothetical protein
MFKLLESQGQSLQRPLALVLNYAALDFNFTSWMSPDNLRVLRSEDSSGYIPGMAQQRNHYLHVSPLSMVGHRNPLPRHRSWRDTARSFFSRVSTVAGSALQSRSKRSSTVKARTAPSSSTGHVLSRTNDDDGVMSDEEGETDYVSMKEEDRPIKARVRFQKQNTCYSNNQEQTSCASDGFSFDGKATIGTRLTMTSRTGYFQDRIISPSMVRFAMKLTFRV